MNEIRKLMEAIEKINESTRQDVAMWQDYDPEKVSDPDEREWETDPKILAYDEENRRLQKAKAHAERMSGQQVDEDDGVPTHSRSFEELCKRYKNRSGFVIMGAGGALNEWAKGLSNELASEGISASGNPDEVFSEYGHITGNVAGDEGRTDAFFLFGDENKIDVGKLAMWRIARGGVSWIDDFCDNFAEDYEESVEEEIKKGIPGGRPFIDLSGPDGNAFAIMGHAKSYAKQLGLDGDAIVDEMQKGDYENLLNVFDSYFGDYVDLYRGESEFEESVEIIDEDSNENREIAEQLNDIKEEIKDLIHNAQGMLRGTSASDSANAYWVPHILMALDDEHDYLGGSMTSMQDTIDELLEGEDEEEEDTSHLSSREFRDLEEDELTHGTYAITDTSDLTPDEVNVGDRYVRNDNPHYKITRKSRNHFTVTNLGSGKSFGVAYKGNEHLAKPDYFKRNTKYL